MRQRMRFAWNVLVEMRLVEQENTINKNGRALRDDR